MDGWLLHPSLQSYTVRSTYFIPKNMLNCFGQSLEADALVASLKSLQRFCFRKHGTHGKPIFVQQTVKCAINYHGVMSNIYSFIYFKDLFAPNQSRSLTKYLLFPHNCTTNLKVHHVPLNYVNGPPLLLPFHARIRKYGGRQLATA